MQLDSKVGGLGVETGSEAGRLSVLQAFHQMIETGGRRLVGTGLRQTGDVGQIVRHVVDLAVDHAFNHYIAESHRLGIGIVGAVELIDGEHQLHAGIGHHEVANLELVVAEARRVCCSNLVALDDDGRQLLCLSVGQLHCYIDATTVSSHTGTVETDACQLQLVAICRLDAEADVVAGSSRLDPRGRSEGRRRFRGE